MENNQAGLVVTEEERKELDEQCQNTIYVADLPKGCSYTDIDEIFTSYDKKKVIIKKTPGHFYYAFVIFKDKQNGQLKLN